MTCQVCGHNSVGHVGDVHGWISRKHSMTIAADKACRLRTAEINFTFYQPPAFPSAAGKAVSGEHIFEDEDKEVWRLSPG